MNHGNLNRLRSYVHVLWQASNYLGRCLGSGELWARYNTGCPLLVAQLRSQEIYAPVVLPSPALIFCDVLV